MQGSLALSLVVSSSLAFSSALGCAASDTDVPADEPAQGGSGNAGASGGAGGTGGPTCVPGIEICDGGDNDCDDEVDEGCSCTEGDTQACYSGRRETEGVGECGAGTQTCTVEGAWGACRGEVLPGAEECNAKDDDCNDAVDDMGEQTCGIGVCAVTVPACTDGQPVTCTPGSPMLETCDGVDNDCDQLTDESFTEQGGPCSTGLQGNCAAGAFACVSGAVACVPNQSAVNEACNDVDDDCNGTIDDNVPGTGGQCDTGFPGPCNMGSIACQGGVIDCFAIAPPTTEICDGIDNDCDGTDDEGDPGSGAICDTGSPGVCQSGVEHCVGGALQCVADLMGSVEVCNGDDDDCDGTVDEGNPGGGLQCGCGGTSFCIGGAVTCVGGPAVYFEDNFNNGNAKGWTLGTEWSIGPAVAGCQDPGTDHTAATSDNNVAGVVLGGCYNDTATHPFYYLESAAFDTSAAAQVHLQYWRWLQSDYTPYVNNVIEVFNGSGWVQIWQSGPSPGMNDTMWIKHQFDITAHKNAQMRVRWGHTVLSVAAFADGGWNIDDVKVTASPCP